MANTLINWMQQDLDGYVPLTLGDDTVDTDTIVDDSVTGDDIKDLTIENADVSATAAIAWSKMAALTNGQLLIGNGSNVATDVAMSGDATIDNAGALTIANDAVELAMLAPGITPSHIVVFAGEYTWSGGGTSAAETVTGALDTDIVLATIQSAPTEAAYLASAAVTADTVTVTLSAANTSNDAVIAYQILRAAS